MIKKLIEACAIFEKMCLGALIEPSLPQNILDEIGGSNKPTNDDLPLPKNILEEIEGLSENKVAPASGNNLPSLDGGISSGPITLQNGEAITEEDIKVLSKYKPALGSEFWRKFAQMSVELSPTKTKDAVLKVANLIAQVLRDESGFNPQAVARNKKTGKPIAKGLPQLLKRTALSLGITQEQWDNMEKPGGMTAVQQLPFVQKLFKSYGIRPNMRKEDLHARNFGGYYHQPKGPKGEDIAYASKAYTSSSGQQHPNTEFQDKAYRANLELDVVIGPDGKLVTDANGNPARKGFISKKDLSPEASRARMQHARSKQKAG